MTIIFDIEADGFLRQATKIHTIVGYEPETSIYHIYVDKDENLCYPKKHILYTIEDYLQLLASNTIVGQNIYSYDLPLLTKLYNYSYKPNLSIVDTIIMSRLSYPDRPGHSLEYWGNLFSFPKGSHKDFSCISQEMLDYCIQDVNITRRVYETLLREMSDWNWDEALLLEYNMQHLQTKQEATGVLFDVDKANLLLDKIVKEINEIDEKVIPLIPPTVKDLGEVRKPFLKDGSFAAITERWLNDSMA